MNLNPMNRMSILLSSCLLASVPAASSAQEAPLLEPLRLTDLTTSSEEVVPESLSEAPISEEPSIASTEASSVSASSESVVEGSETQAPSAEVTPAAVEAASSRWSSLPLPGGEADVAAAAPAGGVDGSGARDVLQVGGGLAGVLFLIWILRMLVRKSARTGAGRGLLARVRAPEGVASILARYPVARGEHVVLLEVGRRILVVHQASGSMTTLSEVTDRDEVADIRARVNGEEREKVEESFAPAFEASLESDAESSSLQPVEGMPGFVAETVDLTRRKRRSLAGGAV